MICAVIPKQAVHNRLGKGLERYKVRELRPPNDCIPTRPLIFQSFGHW
jgi:hypothetical protein